MRGADDPAFEEHGLHCYHGTTLIIEEEQYGTICFVGVDANPAAESVYGLSTQELLGRSIAEFLPKDFDFTSAWKDFQSTGASRDTVTVIGADGVERCVEYTATSDVVPGQHFMTVRETSPSEE